MPGGRSSAWARFLDAAGLARAAGQLEREQACRERAAKLEAKLARLRIDVVSTAPALEVRKDGDVVSRVLWGLSIPVDPGRHVVTATAPGRRPFRLEIDIAPGNKLTVLEIPALARVPKAGAPANWGVGLVSGVALGGVALAGASTGAIFGVKAARKNDEASALCPRYNAKLRLYECSSEAEFERHAEAVREAREAREVSVIAFVVGGAAAAASGVLLWNASGALTQHRAFVTPSLTRRDARLTLTGTFE
jgi:hypothetical protein